MGKEVLVVLSEWGYWGEELVGPLEVFDKHGYKTTFVTPKGKRAHALPPSMTAGYFDPPLGKSVTDEYFAQKTREIDASPRLDNPLNLSSWFPERPYFSSPNFGHALEAYYKARDEAWEELEKYDALLIVGGSGPIVDLVNNQRVHDVILGFLHRTSRSPPSATAWPASPLPATGWTARASSAASTSPATRSTTTRTARASWAPTSTWGRRRIRSNYPSRRHRARTATTTAASADTISTILDYPFLTGRSTQDSHLIGELMVEVLESGLQRYGW